MKEFGIFFAFFFCLGMAVGWVAGVLRGTYIAKKGYEEIVQHLNETLSIIGRNK